MASVYQNNELREKTSIVTYQLIPSLISWGHVRVVSDRLNCRVCVKDMVYFTSIRFMRVFLNDRFQSIGDDFLLILATGKNARLFHKHIKTH